MTPHPLWTSNTIFHPLPFNFTFMFLLFHPAIILSINDDKYPQYYQALDCMYTSHSPFPWRGPAGLTPPAYLALYATGVHVARARAFPLPVPRPHRHHISTTTGNREMFVGQKPMNICLYLMNLCSSGKCNWTKIRPPVHQGRRT
jgi:hypothetical protein